MAKIATVFGATGLTGGRAARELIKSGWTVRGVTRAPSGDAAQALEALGVTIVSADLGDRAAVRSAIDGAGVVYFVGSSLADKWDSGQAIQGIVAAEVAAEVGVGHYIYQSALVETGRGVLGIGSKRAIEERIVELGLPATIVRPSAFMDNLKTYFPVSEQDGQLVLAMPLPTDAPQQLVSANDIGRAAAAIAGQGDAYVGSELNLIADTLTLSQMAEVLSECIGRTTVPFQIPLEGLEANWPQGVPVYRWLSDPRNHNSSSSIGKLIDRPEDFRTWATANIAPQFRV